MRIITALALGSATLALASPANAQSCDALTSAAKDASYTLDEDALNRISDQLNALMTQAEKAGDGPACSCAVKQMNDLIAQNGGEADSEYPGSCSGSVTTGRPGGQGSSGLIASNDSDTSDETDSDEPAPYRPTKRLYGDISQEELNRIARSLPAYARENTMLVNEFVVEVKTARATLEEAEAAYKDKAPPALSETQQALDKVFEVALELRSIVINDEDDVLFAQLEDALRREQEARNEFGRKLLQWITLNDLHEEEKKKRAEDEADEALLAPLTPPSLDDLELASLDPMIEPIKKAKIKMRAAERRMWKAQATVKLIRNKIDPYILVPRDKPFLDMKPGYKEAFKSVETKLGEETDAACGKNGAARGNARCAQLLGSGEERASEYDAVFKRYVVPLTEEVKVPSYYYLKK